MSDAVKVALIVSIAPTLAALIGLIVSLTNKSKLNALHVDINSRLTELIAASALSERSQGIEEGRRLGAADAASRTVESERVEDRGREKGK